MRDPRMRTSVQLAIILLTIMMTNLPSCNPLNPSEVGMGEISDRYKAVRDKGDLLQKFSHVEIVNEVQRTKYDETQEKEEKDIEKWKTKYVVGKEEEQDDKKGRGGGKGRRGNDGGRKDDQNASQDAPSTRLPRFEAPRVLEGHPPASRSTGMLISIKQYIEFLLFYLPKIDDVNPECRRDLHALDVGLMNISKWMPERVIWPLTMVDSWGKTADGIMEGNFNLMGFFKECVNVDVAMTSPPADFQGKYCTIVYKHLSGNDSLLDEYDNKPSLMMPITLASGSFLPSSFYATCMPSTCTQEELRNTLVKTYYKTGYEVVSVQCQTQDDHHDLTGGEIFGIVFFSIIGIVLLAASVIDVWSDYYPYETIRHGPLKYLLVFSVPCNVQKLFHIDTGKNRNVIGCLHGLRFLSICWVILGHQYAYSSTVSSNIVELPQMASKVAFQMIANGDLSVDTFFLMSGMLVSLTVLTQLKKRGSFNAPIYFLHRFVRLFPPIAITCAFLATLSSLLVKGPFAWYYEGFVMKGCRHSWWMDVTFVSNFIDPYLSNMNKANESSSCMPHCWFTAVDMQLYIITPLILLPMYFWEKKGMILLGLWTAASVIVPATITGVYDLWPASMLIQDTEASLQYNWKAYLMPWCRAGPYMVGIAVGYVLYIAKDSPSITRLSKTQVAIGWVATTAVALSIVFGIEKYNKVKLPGTPPEISLAESVMYGGFHRAVWGVVVGWMILACHWGYGGPINWFLSHPIWQPLSRLTYCIYLTSLPIQFALLSSTVRLPYYSNLTKFTETCGVLFITIMCSIALTLVSEAPILRLEKLILHPFMAVRRPDSGISTHQLTVGIDEKSDSEDPPERASNAPA